MPAKPGPNEARLREMRESRYAERLHRPQVEPEAKADKVARAKALVVSQPAVANAMANKDAAANRASSTYKNRDTDARRAYQRDLMRRRRAAAVA